MAQDKFACPRCDSKNTKRLSSRLFGLHVKFKWYRCIDCSQMWGTPKQFPPKQRPIHMYR